MTDVATDLVMLAATVDWVDAAAGDAARSARDPGAGRLAELAEWLAATQRRYPPQEPRRPRCLVIGPVPPAVAADADAVDVGVRALDLAPDAGAEAALRAGVAAADDEVDQGADLVIVTAAPTTAAAVLVSVLTGAEPVALLPRGAAATDTAAWIARADELRRTRRRVAALRGRPHDLLIALDDPTLAATAGFLVRAAARRTALVLDDSTAVAAALLAHHAQPRTGGWWQLADASPDPAHARAAAELGQRPLLDLAMTTSGGRAGLLTVPMIRAATQRHDAPDARSGGGRDE